jgi:GTP-sensing pleiotropic transcriptional regulator CodY
VRKLDVEGRTLLVAALFIASIFILALKLITPTELHIYLEGEEAVLSQILRNYTFSDVAIVVVSAFVSGLSMMYLILHDRGAVAGDVFFKQKRDRYEKVIPTLKVDEQKILQAVLDADGIIQQSELGELTGVSRSGVTRALDILESRGFIERRRRGMSNVIVLK